MTDTTSRATGTFKIANWDEQPYAETDGAPKLTHARVTTTYSGDLAGLRGDGGYVAKQGEPEVGFELRWSLG